MSNPDPAARFRESTGIARVACIAAGSAFAFGFAPWSLWPVAMASLLVLYLSIHGVGNRLEALVRCFLFALGKFGTGAYWVFLSLYEYAAISTVLAAALFGGFLLLASAVFSIAALFAVKTRYAILDALLFASGMCCAEIALSIPWALSFPWLHVGYALIDTPLASYAPWGGVWLVGFAGVLSAVALAQALTRRWVTLGVVVVVWCGALLLPSPLSSEAEPIAVVAVQGNVALEDKWAQDASRLSLDRYLALSAGFANADLVVWPESALPVDVGMVKGRIPESARFLDGRLLFGAFEDAVMDGKSTAFNVVAALENDDLSVYRKERLVPFAEYVPFGDAFGWILRPLGYPMSSLTPFSARQDPLRVAGRTLAVAICYEVAYPQIVHRRARGADLIVVVSEDSWLGDTSGPWQHHQIARMRALESGRYLVRATNDGITAIIDPSGTVAGVLPRYTADVLTGWVSSSNADTFFQRFGLAAIGTIVLLVLAVDWMLRTKRRRSGHSRAAGKEQ